MSLTSYRAAPSRAEVGHGVRAGWPGAMCLCDICEWVCPLRGYSRMSAGCNAWRRPTLPGLEPQYHRRSLVSRPSSGWDRVGHRRHGHQAMKQALMRAKRVLIDAPCRSAGPACSTIGRDAYPSPPPAIRARPRAVDDGGILQARKEQLGPVSSMGYPTSTSGLSTSWSTTAR